MTGSIPEIQHAPGGYTIERVICDRPYNDIQPWHYHRLVEVFGGGLGLDVRTEGELEDALVKAAATDSLVFIEIHTGRLDCPESSAVQASPWQRLVISTDAPTAVKNEIQERKDYYYANQSQNSKGLHTGKPRRGNRDSQGILLR